MKKFIAFCIFLILGNSIFAVETVSDIPKISISEKESDKNIIQIKGIKLKEKQKVYFCFLNCQVGNSKFFFKEFIYGFASLHGDQHARLCPKIEADPQIKIEHFHKDKNNPHRSEIKIQISDYSLPIYLNYEGNSTWNASISLSKLVADKVLITKTKPEFLTLNEETDKNDIFIIFENLNLSSKELLIKKIIEKMETTDTVFIAFENAKKNYDEITEKFNKYKNQFKEIKPYELEIISYDRGEVYAYIVCKAGYSDLLYYTNDISSIFVIYSDHKLNILPTDKYAFINEHMLLKKNNTSSTIYYRNKFSDNDFICDDYRICNSKEYDEYEDKLKQVKDCHKLLEKYKQEQNLLIQKIKNDPNHYKYVLTN